MPILLLFFTTFPAARISARDRFCTIFDVPETAIGSTDGRRMLGFAPVSERESGVAGSLWSVYHPETEVDKIDGVYER